MDTKTIQKHGEYILSYRLRTARQRKRMQYEDFEKFLIQLNEENRELYQRKRNLGWEPLVPPVQKGWKRFFVLRNDVARSKHADFFQGILKKINTYDWSYRKDFLVRRRRFGKKVYVVKGQKLLEPHEYHFAKLCFNEKEKQMFREEHRYGYWNRKPGNKVYVFNEPWRFVLVVKPNFITRVRIRDEVIEARLNAIDYYLERNCLEWKQQKILYGNCRWRHWHGGKKPWEINGFKNWPVERILDYLKNENDD